MQDAGGWDQLTRGVELPVPDVVTVPELHEVDVALPEADPVADVAEAAARSTAQRFAGVVRPGMTVAVGAGSRGLSARVELLAGTVRGLRALGAEPFVVPAMGSHGGGTADGQRAMLTSLGVTEDAVGAEIRATMDTVVVARTDDGMPIHLDTHAAAADAICCVNRMKPHTCFRGPVESGLTKMAVVGFGKQPGAAQIHACGPVEMRDRLLAGVAALRATGRLLGGVASVEGPDGAVVRVEALGADEMGAAPEMALSELARSFVPALPFPVVDVLIVERGGKDISGTTIDPNVTGRFWVHGLDDPPTPKVATIVLCDITDVSAGNVLGIGLADFVPASLANKIDWAKTYLNCFTAGPSGVRRSRLPMVLPDTTAAVRVALAMCGRAHDAPKRVVRIASTLHLQRMWVSEPLLAELPAHVCATGRTAPGVPG
jgi:hypothetical protein